MIFTRRQQFRASVIILLLPSAKNKQAAADSSFSRLRKYQHKMFVLSETKMYDSYTYSQFYVKGFKLHRQERTNFEGAWSHNLCKVRPFYLSTLKMPKPGRREIRPLSALAKTFQQSVESVSIKVRTQISYGDLFCFVDTDHQKWSK